MTGYEIGAILGGAGFFLVSVAFFFRLMSEKI